MHIYDMHEGKNYISRGGGGGGDYSEVKLGGGKGGRGGGWRLSSYNNSHTRLPTRFPKRDCM